MTDTTTTTKAKDPDTARKSVEGWRLLAGFVFAVCLFMVIVCILDLIWSSDVKTVVKFGLSALTIGAVAQWWVKTLDNALRAIRAQANVSQFFTRNGDKNLN